jgi:hypothetical protein
VSRPRPAGVLAALGLAAALWTTAPPVGAASAQPAPDVSVTVTAIDPVAAGPGDQVTVSGSVTNRGGATLLGVNVQLRVGTDPVGSRSQLAALAGGSSRPPGVVPVSVPDRLDLAPGASLPFVLQFPVDSLGLTAAGVYPLAVEVITGPQNDRNRVATLRTFLPWDMAAVMPTRLAVLWPVLSTPSRDGDGVPVGTRLHDEIAGRLTDVLAAGAGVKLTWLVDGDTLQGASSLAGGAPTAGGQQPPRTSQPDPAARTWLQGLEHETAGAQVVAVPYADPDLVGTVRAGLAGDLAQSTALGPQTAAEVLGRPATAPLPLLDWPADGTADRATLRALPGTGASTVLLSDASAAPVRSVTYTPSGAGPLSGTGLTAVVADSVLSNLLATSPGRQGGPALARQRVLAELAMVGAERPSLQRSLVIVPPRRWNPDPVYVQGLLRAVAAAGWVQLVSLSDLTSTAAQGPARQQPAYSAGARSRELDAAQYADVRAGHQRLGALSAVISTVSQPAAVADQLKSYAEALLRSESAAWRSARAAGQAYVRGTVDLLARQQRRVHLVSPGAVTLAARSGKIPVTVVNDMDQQVTVRVGVQAVPPVRLKLTQPPPITLEPHSSTTLDIAAEATTNGSLLVVAQLLTVDGRPYGDPETFPVQITGLGAVAQLVVVGALLLLTAALVVRVVRAVRSGRRRPGSAASVRGRAR